MTDPKDSTSHETGRHAVRLPGPALAALYLGVVLLPLAVALFGRAAPADPWEHAAAALGMVAVVAMAVQFVTSGRFDRVSRHLGIDKIMAFHKIAAWWVLVAVVLHPLFYVLPTWLDAPALGRERLAVYLTSPHYRSGVVAWAAFALLLATSLLREKLPWRYETWRATHLPLGVLAVAGSLHHAFAAGRFTSASPLPPIWLATGVAVAAVVGVLYGWRWFKLHRHPWRLASVSRVADRMWQLHVEPAPGTPPLIYRAGQFVWLTVGRRRFPLLDHPFSLSDSPLDPGTRLIIKEVGDFTSTVGALVPGTPIGLDGPYGEFVLEGSDAEAVILIAGGVGIAPIMGLLRDILARGERRPVRLAYAVGAPANFACLDEIEAARTRLDLHVLLLSESSPPDYRGEVGRLDRQRLTTLLEGLDLARSVVLMCGPGGMVTAVSDALLDVGMPMRRILYERFDYTAGSSRQDRRRTRRFAAIGAGLALGVAMFALAAS
ncbi:iron reductase [Halomonas sp. MCCC 1A17488]|uniref:ferredoxin reductase family protein n=1 Tax=unclassified Halomonas TaxID=2609666 RepID=UPI0018D2726E|nr:MULTISPECIES: ferredoxin reductase family protein [unclassified Halomonas]MCE8015780.1 iron reductase [Halomonas sp. MCCC 1A17488]MCG3239113.1 iron reductase [Halomonas sp. MCCC 1A17488]QPP50943.1 ferric reductase-like transmembrane domain-containing protein [Halomonas sp. SS10-MC5]